MGLFSNCFRLSVKGTLRYPLKKAFEIIGILPSLITQELWRDRCAAVYDNRSSPASVLTARVARSLKDLCSLVNPKRILSAQQKQILLSLHIVDYTQHSTPRLVKWLRPPAGLKLNTDGCSRGNPGSSAGAGVIRNSSGDFVLAYSNFDGLSSSLLAEFRAIIDGLRICHQKNIKISIVESDSKSVIDIISRRQAIPWILLRWWPERKRLDCREK